MHNTILINDETSVHTSSASFVHFFKAARDGVNITGSTMVGPGDIVEVGSRRQPVPAGNFVWKSRAAAGLPAYPTLPPLQHRRAPRREDRVAHRGPLRRWGYGLPLLWGAG